MKALVLENNGILKYKELSNPNITSNECLISVKSAGICNSDIDRAYNNGAYFYPLIMGHEFAGEIVEVGNDVHNYRNGDRVAVFPLIPCKRCEACKTENYAQCIDYDYYGSRRNGAFAQYIAVKEWNLFPIHDDVKFCKAALLEPVSVAIHGLRKLQFDKDDSVAIFGSGIIGLVIARYLSNILKVANIYVIDHNDWKLDIAKGYGAVTINYQIDFDWSKNIIKKIGGVTHAIEACGAVDTYRKSLNIVKSHGNILWLGNITGSLHLEKKEVSSILRREIKIYGCWNSKFNHSKDDDWNYALDLLNSIDLKQLITHNVSLEDGESVFRRLYLNKIKKIKDDKEHFLKVVFEVG